jgi:hypothetical protein
MRPVSKQITRLLGLCVPFALAAWTVVSPWVATAAEANGPELNGITVIFGDRRAFFSQPGVQGENFSLAEGQSAHGIKLLAVDAIAKTARIDADGRIKTIRICGTPVLTVVQNGTAVLDNNNAGLDARTAANGALNSDFNLMPSADQPSSAKLALLASNGGDIASLAAVRRNPNNDPTPVAGQPEAGSDAAPMVIPEVPPLDGRPFWLAASEYVENVRRLTAAQVAAGTAEPQSLTPLTPPGTPAALIGNGKSFFNH